MSTYCSLIPLMGFCATPIIIRSKIPCCFSSSPTEQFVFKTYWTALIKETNQKLNDAVPLKYPERLHEAMRYSLLTKGAKRVPPLLCIAAYELFGGSRSAAFPTACALEMIHLSTMIHDDLPCIDDSSSRRGQPCSHKVFGVDMAILAGGALTLVGFRNIISQTPTDVVPESRVIEVIAGAARTIGSTRMASARFVQLSGAPNAGDFVKENKFGETCRCSAACGGILAGASDDEIQRLRNYGWAVGVLYQVVEDILEEMKGEIGKSYVWVYGMEKAMEVVEDLRCQAKRELDGFDKYGDKVLPLYDFVDYAAHRGFNIGE